MSSVRVRYETIEFGDVDIHVRTLRDTQEFSDDDGVAEGLGISSARWAIWGVVWRSSKVLAHLMAGYDVKGRRILEVGCGIGLASLVLNHRQSDITATDRHPEVERFLTFNTELNDDSPIPFERIGWGDAVGDLGRFDLIIGSDILYESDHSGLLSTFILQHANPTCEVIIVDPSRGERGRFDRLMRASGFETTFIKPIGVESFDPPYKGRIARYLRTG